MVKNREGRVWGLIAGVIGLLLVTVPVTAQDSCPAIVENALNMVDSACADVGRNEACYGNIAIDADLRDAIVFENVGDMAALRDIETLRLSPMNEADGAWGLSVMRLQANLPGTLPGQAVTMLLMGDTTIENAVELAVDGETTPGEPGTIALGQTISDRITDEAFARRYTFDGETGQVIDVTMIAPDDELDTYLQLENSSGDLIDFNDDDASVGGYNSAMRAVTLPENDTYTIVATRYGEAEGTSTGAYDLTLTLNPDLNYAQPMQAFYFTSGIGDSLCSEMPDSGIMVQTPNDAPTVRLLVNEVQVQLGSTAFMQARPGDYMYVYVLEGTGRVESFGVAQIVPAGSVVRIPMDSRPAASGPPETPQPYDTPAVIALPGAALPDTVTPADPIAPEQIVTGDMSIILNWDNDADMDLYLTEPDGTVIFYGSPSSLSGAALDVDANADCLSNPGTQEVISWPSGQPLLGLHTVTVREYAQCEEGLANWTLTVKIGDVVVLEESGTGEASFEVQR